MKKSKVFLLFPMLILLLSGRNKYDIKDKDYTHKVTPPNCVLIDENLYIDQSEISNFHWLEYLYWNRRIFGKKSAEYVAALPDTNVWSKFDSGLVYMNKFGMRHPANRDKPVVGISQAQAIAFAKWRSDRVLEYMLIHAKLLKRESEQTSTNYFTTERYLNGEFMGYKPSQTLTHILVFGLPSIEVWKKALIYSAEKDKAYLSDCRGKTCAGLRQMTLAYSKEDVFKGDSIINDFFRDVLIGQTAPKGSVYNMLGNAAEMVSENGVALGGSWAQTKAEIYNQLEYNFSEPEAWIGFRNQCKWVKVDEFLKSTDSSDL